MCLCLSNKSLCSRLASLKETRPGFWSCASERKWFEEGQPFDWAGTPTTRDNPPHKGGERCWRVIVDFLALQFCNSHQFRAAGDPGGFNRHSVVTQWVRAWLGTRHQAISSQGRAHPCSSTTFRSGEPHWPLIGTVDALGSGSAVKVGVKGATPRAGQTLKVQEQTCDPIGLVIRRQKMIGILNNNI